MSANLYAALAPESGAFVFQNYPSKIYQASPQSFAAAQDNRGVIYVANTNGVLEFDGLFWRLIPLTRSSEAVSLAVDKSGRVYVGGQSVFGYLQADKQGFTRFVPLQPPANESDFPAVSNIVPTSAGVFFGTSTKIFLLSNSGSISVLHPTAKFQRIFSVADELFATTTDAGLKRLKGDEFIAGPTGGDSDMTHGRVVFADGQPPLLASGTGLFRFSLTDIQPFLNAAAGYLAEHKIHALAQLHSGEIAVGTVNGGLVLLDRNGAIERVVLKENGLPSDRVNAIFEDREQAIWIVTDNGIARYLPSLTRFGEPQGVTGTVTSIARLNGSIYAGTTRGLFAMQSRPGAEPQFTSISGLETEDIWALQQHGDESFVAADHGLYLLASGKIEKLPTSGLTYDLSISRRDPEILYSAGDDGVRQWRRTDQKWSLVSRADGGGQQWRTVVEDTDGRLWATSRSSIRRIDMRVTPAKVEIFDSASGVPDDWINAYWFHDHVIFATVKGLRRFSETTHRFEPDTELGASYADGDKGVSLLREDPSGNIWISGRQTSKGGYNDYLRHQPDGNYVPLLFPVLQSGIGEMWCAFVDSDGTLWTSGENGFYRQEKLPAAASTFSLPVLLRQVTVIGQKEAMFGGDSSPLAQRLDYRDNALRFEFAAPFFEDPTAVQFQYKLEGDDKHWSTWGSESRKDYTNLFEGAYRFRVRARDPHGRETSEVVFPFQITAPFYRSYWAYACYLTSFLFAGWLIMRWRLRALQAKNRWLENVVEERTVEVRKERDQNEALLLNILPRPIAAELRTNGAVKPTTFDDATVCFSDFVGFTLSSERMPAEKLISSLNEYFTAFDEIIGRYGLEKLKTIGDAYMFAGGLPSLRPSHAVDSVLAALEMAAAVNRLSKPDSGVNWKIRLGLYSGPVVAGVVGVRKFAFDIWGNTVNFAARMESAGSPGRVNLSETTFERVSQFIQCEPRGGVPIKEGRRMEMYFAIGPKPELLHGPAIHDVPEAFRLAYEKAFGESPRSFPTQATLEDPGAGK